MESWGRVEEVELEAADRLIRHLEEKREELPPMVQAALVQLRATREALGGYLA